MLLDGGKEAVVRVHHLQYLFNLGEGNSLIFRDEYQEDSANLPHIHGLVALHKEDMDNEQLRIFLSGLQKSAVCDLFDSSQIERYKEEGLFEHQDDWQTMTALASRILTHKPDKRCMKRIGGGEGAENFRCRKPHTVFDKENPMEDELIPLKYKFSPACLEALRKCGLWDPPSEGAPNGTF